MSFLVFKFPTRGEFYYAEHIGGPWNGWGHCSSFRGMRPAYRIRVKLK